MIFGPGQEIIIDPPRLFRVTGAPTKPNTVAWTEFILAPGYPEAIGLALSLHPITAGEVLTMVEVPYHKL